MDTAWIKEQRYCTGTNMDWVYLILEILIGNPEKSVLENDE